MTTSYCTNCGNSASVVGRQDYRFKEMGIPVILGRINVIRCSYCGNVDPIIPNMDGLLRVLANAVVCKPQKLSGEEIRFLRAYTGKSAREFARFLHLDHTHLSKIENGKTKTGNQLDKLVRMLVLGMCPSLNAGEMLLELMPEIDDSPLSKQEIQIDPDTLKYEYIEKCMAV